VRIALVFVDDPFHGVVVVDPGLVNVITHGLRHPAGGDPEQLAQPLGSLRMKPQEDGNTIDGLLL